MYQICEFVIYGIHGVCRVMGTEKQLVNRKRSEFLVLEPLVQSGSKYYVPTENPTSMGKLRAVLSRDALLQLMDSDEVRQDHWIQDEGHRKQKYRELIVSADRLPLMQMVSSLYRYRGMQEAAGRKFHQCDDNFLRDAERVLSSEISLVMGLTADEARAFLREHLR